MAPFMGAFDFSDSFVRIRTQKGSGKRIFPVAELFKPRGLKEERLVTTGSRLPEACRNPTRGAKLKRGNSLFLGKNDIIY